MIRNREDLETALEAVSAYLETPPAPGSEDAAEFRRLLHEIDATSPPWTSRAARRRCRTWPPAPATWWPAPTP